MTRYYYSISYDGWVEADNAQEAEEQAFADIEASIAIPHVDIEEDDG